MAELIQNKPPLVSIVTPSFNSMPFIEENIRSVLAQGYPNMEHIIMDGGSTDGTVDLLKTYPHTIWTSERDNGQSQALNKGFKKARGQIIGWLNSDDKYEPGAINAIIKYLNSNPNTDIVYGNINVIDTEGNKIGVSLSKPFNVRTLLSYNIIQQPSVFLRRKVIDQLGGVDETLHYVMDRELWLRAGMAGLKMDYYENGYLANFRLCPGTKSYENAECFPAEWLVVLEKALNTQFFQTMSFKTRQKIINENKSIMYFSRMMGTIENRRKKETISNFRKAVYYNTTLFKNPGAWRVFLLGLIGYKLDKLRRFRKRISNLN